MKILHTSDWHLGQLLHNKPRKDDHQQMIEEMLRIVKEEKPDVFLLSGDVYDTTQPSTEIQKMLADALVNIHNIKPEMTIVCTAGNHDSGSKHMIFSTPWEALNVHMIGSIWQESNLEDYIIRVPGMGTIVAIPYAVDRFMPEDVYKKALELAEAGNEGNLPIVLMAHTAVEGSLFKGHEGTIEKEKQADDEEAEEVVKAVGGIQVRALDIFGEGYDYVALGHIHSYQPLTKDHRICYSGTPVAVGFDEVYSGNKHGVVIAETKSHGGPLTVRHKEVVPYRWLVNLPTDGSACSSDDALKELENFADDEKKESWIRINVETDTALPPDHKNIAAAKLQGKNATLIFVNSKKKAKEGGTVAPGPSIEEFKKIPPTKVVQLWADLKEKAYTDDMKQILQEVIDNLNTYPDLSDTDNEN